MPKTTWTLELKSAAAQRDARAMERELRSLRLALDGVSNSAQRAGRALTGIGAGAGGAADAARRIRAEREVVRERRAGIDAAARAEERRQERNQRDAAAATLNRARMDERDARDRARREAQHERDIIRSLAAEEAGRRRIEALESRRRAAATRDQRRREVGADRAWQAELRRVNRVARAEVNRDRQAQRAAAQRQALAQREESFRARVTNQMLGAYGRQQRQSAAARQRANADHASSRLAVLGLGAGVAGSALSAVLGGALSITSSTIGAAAALAGMVVSAGGLALNLGESVLQMIAFRESALTTLRAMSRGNRAVASEQYRFAQQFAMRTPLDAQQVLQLQSQVSTAGFTGTQNREVLQAAADVGASRPNDATAASRYVLALSQIRNAGKLRAQEMNQLGEVGVGRRDLLLELGRQQNIARAGNETEDQYVARLGRMQEAGRFSGDAGVAAAQGVVRRNLNNEGELGSFATGQGETLLGTLSNLRGSVFTLLTTIDDIENRPGVRALKTVLNGIAMTLSGVTPTGQRLQSIVASIVDDVGLLVGFGVGDFDGTLNGVLDTARELWPFVRDIIGAFTDGALGEARAQFGGIGGEFRDMLRSAETLQDARELGRGLVAIFGAGVKVTRVVISVSGAVAELAGSFSALWRNMGSAEQLATLLRLLTNPFATVTDLAARSALQSQMQGLGMSAVDGIRAGIAAQRGLLDADVAAMAQSIPTTTADALAIRSPSRVMADAVGQHIPTGIAAGIDAGRGPLDAAMSSLVPVPGAGDLGGLASLGGRAGVQIGELNIHVGPGASEESGRAAARGFVDELAALLEVPALAGA